MRILALALMMTFGALTAQAQQSAFKGMCGNRAIVGALSVYEGTCIDENNTKYPCPKIAGTVIFADQPSIVYKLEGTSDGENNTFYMPDFPDTNTGGSLYTFSGQYINDGTGISGTYYNNRKGTQEQFIIDLY